MKIGISLNDRCLGYLEEGDGEYLFYANVKEIAICKNEDPITMMLFNIPDEIVCHLKEIPNVYREYLNGAEREDIVSNAKIIDGDSDFVKLYKIASLNPNVINFKIFVA